MRYLPVFMAIVIFSLAFKPAGSAAEEKINHRFSTSGGSYTFTGDFTVNADKNCLLDMLYDPQRLRQYASHADAVELADQGEGWQKIIYDYSSLFYSSKSTFIRRLDSEADRINYRLTAIEQYGLVSPDISSISGYYQVSTEQDGCRVTFHQQGVIGNGMLSGFYLHNAEKEAVAYLGNMQRYAAENCR